MVTPETWSMVINATQDASALLLTIEMAAVGLAARFDRLRTVGVRPLAAGMAAALIVGMVSLLTLSVVFPAWTPTSGQTWFGFSV
jgi:uncharacterized membrane protein YadS